VAICFVAEMVDMADQDSVDMVHQDLVDTVDKDSVDMVVRMDTTREWGLVVSVVMDQDILWVVVDTAFHLEEDIITVGNSIFSFLM
jgi:putative heme iron utilization protein